jgi:DNA replication licensing factor MCM7
VALIIELDDVYEFDSGLAEAVVNNTRRYVSIASEVVYEMLPDYKQREVRESQYLDISSP